MISVKKVYVQAFINTFKIDIKESKYGLLDKFKARVIISFLEELDPDSILTFRVN